MPASVIESREALKALIGRELDPTQWMAVTQERIDLFAEATGDAQWIHVNRERAARESPFKTTIAHGFLTLALLSQILREAVQFPGLRMAVNYGLNRVRFPSAVFSDSKIRGRIALQAVKDLPEGSEAVWLATLEGEQAEKPCCVAEWVVRYYW